MVGVRESDGVYFIGGELDVSSAEQFRRDLEPALDGESELVLDLTELTFVDSFGLRTIGLLARMVGDRGLVLRNPRDEVLRVLDLLDIEDVPGIRVERW